MPLLRLSRYLAQCGLASRRKAESLISEGKVSVNGKTVTSKGQKIDSKKDKVVVKGKEIKPAQRGVILLHKPIQVVSTLYDPQGRPTVGDYLSTNYRSYFPVGRLDWDSSGLLIMTNDGELANRLLHPRYGFTREYEVSVRGNPSEKTLGRIEKGVYLEDGMVRVKITNIRIGDATTVLRLEISEGRNRIVRRLMAKLRHPVIKLKRLSHGPFYLGKLKPGEIRKLSEREYNNVRKGVVEDGYLPPNLTFNPHS